MATRKYPPGPGVQSDIRTSFTTKEGGYRVVKASQYNRPSGQPLFGKELSHVHVSFVSCKDKEGPCEWVVFNAGRELYFYPFEGVGKVRWGVLPGKGGGGWVGYGGAFSRVVYRSVV